jgi:tetratricopeptide (TPR) repeat protein
MSNPETLSSTTIRPEKAIMKKLRQASDLQDAKLYDRSIQILGPLAKLTNIDKKTRARVLYSLGRAYYKVRDFAQAEQALKAALELDDSNAEYLFSLGNVFLFSERFSEAILTYESALEVSPNSVPCLSNLGIALQRNGELEKAEKILRRSLALDPENAVIKEALKDLALERAAVTQ